MNDATPTRIGIVGGGQMGAGIAEVCARSECDVILVESDSVAVERAAGRLEASLARALRSGKLPDAETTTAVRNRMRLVDDLEELADRELVIEAIPEEPEPKIELFGRLDAVAAPGAVLASNTSSIPIMKLAMATSRAEQVLGLHFFNPVPVLPLVEVIPSLLTTTETLERSSRFVSDVLGKTVIRAQDRAGFVVNALLIPYLLSAVRMLESGSATLTDIDEGMVLGCAHPMGPLALADLIGLDTTAAVAESMYEEFKEPMYSPPPLLQRMVAGGLLGRKSGHGFYSYQDGQKEVSNEKR
jgi:3-hydroxybutyryl-CoA dehydrogenase